MPSKRPETSYSEKYTNKQIRGLTSWDIPRTLQRPYTTTTRSEISNPATDIHKNIRDKTCYEKDPETDDRTNIL